MKIGYILTAIMGATFVIAGLIMSAQKIYEIGLVLIAYAIGGYHELHFAEKPEKKVHPFEIPRPKNPVKEAHKTVAIVDCDMCGGSGMIPDIGQNSPCPDCQGLGTKRVACNTMREYLAKMKVSCAECVDPVEYSGHVNVFAKDKKIHIHPAEKELEEREEAECGMCAGTGMIEGTGSWNSVTCPNCKGKGITKIFYCPAPKPISITELLQNGNEKMTAYPYIKNSKGEILNPGEMNFEAERKDMSDGDKQLMERFHKVFPGNENSVAILLGGPFFTDADRLYQTLKKYMAHVIEIEGTSFMEFSGPDGRSLDRFTPEEITGLKYVEESIHAIR
jgi:hypothetical protein